MSSMLSIFARAAKCYVLPIPFTRDKFFSKLARDVGLSLVMQAGVHGVVGNILYPSIAEKLVELGIDEDMAAQVDHYPFSFVRPSQPDRTLADHLFSLTDAPTIGGMLLGLWGTRQYSQTHAIPYPVCDVAMPAVNDFSAQDFIGNLSLMRGESIENTGLSKDQILTQLLLHEAGHCDVSENIGLATYKTLSFIVDVFSSIPGDLYRAEAAASMHAEHHSDMVFADVSGDNAAIKEFLLAARSIRYFHFWNDGYGYEHDLMLVFDSEINGTPMPTTEEILSSQSEIVAYVRAERGVPAETVKVSWATPFGSSLEKRSTKEDEFAVFLTKTMHKFLVEEADTASPFARRRAELYLDAVNYFSPALYSRNIPAADEAIQTVAIIPLAPL